MERRDSRFNHLLINGFTLIEVLIGISIFMIIITAIYTTFSQGISVTKRGDEKVSLYQELRLSLDEISTALRNTTKLGNEKFEGKDTYLNFLALDTQKQTLSKITYQWDENKLLKRETFLAWQENKDLEETMIESVDKVEFKYLDLEDIWHETWKTNKPPKAVKVSLYADKKMFTTTVWIPIGSSI
ncbi:MAG: type II secretion system protein GspJ [bacterium]